MESHFRQIRGKKIMLNHDYDIICHIYEMKNQNYESESHNYKYNVEIMT